MIIPLHCHCLLVLLPIVQPLFFTIKHQTMKKVLFICSLFLGSIVYGQGIISPVTGKLRTVPASGSLISPLSPKFGINLDPTTNLDVEGIPETGLKSNLRFRNLPATTDTMVLVRDKDGFVTWRGISTFPGSPTTGSGWLLTGNTVASTDFIGTLNNDDMRFNTNGIKRMRLLSQGSLSVETPTAANASNDVGNMMVGIRNSVNTGNSNMVSGWENRLNNAAANIVAGQLNVVSNPSGALVSKSVAVGWANNVQDHNQYLIGAANSAKQEYSGVFGVALDVTADGCWYLGGNSGTTLSNDIRNSLAVGWDRIHTGLFNGDGLTLGTGTASNTNAGDEATARLDVNGPAFSSVVTGVLFPSGVRFRDLPFGTGNILVVDPDGYVYRSTQMARTQADGGALNGEIEQLKKQILQLQEQVQGLLAQRGMPAMVPVGNNTLTVSPTPFKDRATVSYAIENYKDNALLQVVDSKGVLLKTIPLRQAKGQVEVIQPTIPGGMLVFSILVDGRPVITQKSMGL
jgi:hypothetical protein